MTANPTSMRPYLKSFDFKGLFINELNWGASHQRPIVLNIGTEQYQFNPLAEQGGFVIYEVGSAEGEIPGYATRRKIENQIKSQVHEHILVFVDKARTHSIWQWVKRGIGQSAAAREHEYNKGQPGDSLLQKLAAIGFDFSELDENGNMPISSVTAPVTRAFDVEKVTKRFYDEFKDEHDTFCKFLKGIENQEELAWYTSVMLNRLMFIYFIQKKGFLNGDQNYLLTKLKESQKRGPNQYYDSFLKKLFFEGFAKEKAERSPEVNALLGSVPYLNGGLFLRHQLELAHGETISISDAAFANIFALFDRYNWHLDYRPLKKDDEINPDVLGYIFEKYINQKQMGAYYTKEDITDYICKNTIVPFLFDKIATQRPEDLTSFPMKDVDPYIYDSVKQEEYLPTETEREYHARHKRYEQIKADFIDGKITNINDLITYNLDIRSFAEDWLGAVKDPLTLRFFYFQCLSKVTVLDPTVGSGAFLFAALNILEPLYEICLDKMEELSSPKYPDFAEELARVNQHPNRKYFVLKSIIVNNLFGVDIMEEAVEICKLRLFLKLVAQVDDANKIEPLPDIDFNIRAGNTLVGYASEEDINKAKATKLDLGGTLANIEKRIESADRSLKNFREAQTRFGITASELSKDKNEVKGKLAEIRNELDRDLFAFYGVRNFEQFMKTYQPFHWFVEFYGIMKDGGFDVIIGNPPYLEKKQVNYSLRDFRSLDSGAVHAMCMERAVKLLHKHGCMSMIVPMSLVSTQRMEIVQHILENKRVVWYSNYSWRPGKLFDTVNRALTIFVIAHSEQIKVFSTTYQKWNSQDRGILMQRLMYIRIPTSRTCFWVPKLGDSIETNILSKCLAINNTMGNQMVKNGYRIYYRTTGGLYWKVFTDFAPNFSCNGKPGHSTRETWFIVANKDMVTTCVAILSSDLFWWWYTISTNCRDLNPSDIQNFPVPQAALQDIQLSKLGGQYLEDLQRNSMTLIREQKQTGRTETQLFKIQKSKAIIDQIDLVLAKHYGISPKELDFISNYDIKYRMGKDSEEEE